MLESLDYEAGQGHFSTGLNGQDSIAASTVVLYMPHYGSLGNVFCA